MEGTEFLPRVSGRTNVVHLWRHRWHDSQVRGASPAGLTGKGVLVLSLTPRSWTEH